MAAINGTTMAQPEGTISGAITAGGVLTKVGGGTLVLSNAGNQFQGQSRLYVQSANNYTGNTTINAGNLQMANANGSALGTGAITLNGGTLSVQTGTVSIQGGVLNVNTAQQAMLSDLELQAGVLQDQKQAADLQGKITLNADVAAQTASRYRDKLAVRQQAEVTGVGGGGQQIGGFEGLGEGRGRAGFGGGGEAEAAERPAAPAPPTGLASLDVDLPPRGIVYRFTSRAMCPRSPAASCRSSGWIRCCGWARPSCWPWRHPAVAVHPPLVHAAGPQPHLDGHDLPGRGGPDRWHPAVGQCGRGLLGRDHQDPPAPGPPQGRHGVAKKGPGPFSFTSLSPCGRG